MSVSAEGEAWVPSPDEHPPLAPGTNIWEFSYPAWYPRFRARAVKSEVIPLTTAALEYLIEDDVDIPDEVYHIDQRYANRTRRPGAGSERPCPPALPTLVSDLRGALQRLGGAAFPKTSWSSPRDAAWMSHDGSLKCEHPRDVLVLLKASAACGGATGDLCGRAKAPVMVSARGWASENDAAAADVPKPVLVDEAGDPVILDETHPDYDPLRALEARRAAMESASAGAAGDTEVAAATALYGPDALTVQQRVGHVLTAPAHASQGRGAAPGDEPAATSSSVADSLSEHSIVLKKWSTLHPWREVRCYVAHGHLVAVSQRDDEVYPELQAASTRDCIRKGVEAFHAERMKRVPLSSTGEDGDAAGKGFTCGGFKSPHFCYDLYVDTKGRGFLLDVGPIGPDTGATALVDWDRHLGALAAAGEDVDENGGASSTFYSLMAAMAAMDKSLPQHAADEDDGNGSQRLSSARVELVGDDTLVCGYPPSDATAEGIARLARAGAPYPVPFLVVTPDTAAAAGQRATVAAVLARLPRDRADLTDADAIERLIAEQKALGNVQGSSDDESD